MRTDLDLCKLIACVQAGDHQALGTLYDAYQDRLASYCSQRLPDPNTAKPCVQAVFVEVWRVIGSFKYESDLLFLAWLYKITNYVLTQSRWTWTPRTNRSRIQPQRSPGNTAQIADDHTALFQALNRLPAEQQDVITLKFCVGLSNREIATAMDRTEDAIKVLQHRAINRLYQLTAC